MRRSGHAAVVLCLLALAGCMSISGGAESTATAGSTTAATATEATETGPTVTLRDDNGSRLGTVQVRVADTYDERFTGLSETESLGPDEGMLFVHDEEGEYAYVMRRMSFPLDIVFVAANGTVTAVHHAPVEPGASGDELTRYTGRGKYVLEVNRGYANRTGLDPGDTLALPPGVD